MHSQVMQTKQYKLSSKGGFRQITLPQGSVILGLIFPGGKSIAYLHVGQPCGENLVTETRKFWVFGLGGKAIDPAIAKTLAFVAAVQDPNQILWELWEQVGPTRSLWAVMKRAQDAAQDALN
jgi:hypothetical protein